MKIQLILGSMTTQIRDYCIGKDDILYLVIKGGAIKFYPFRSIMSIIRRAIYCFRAPSNATKEEIPSF